MIKVGLLAKWYMGSVEEVITDDDAVFSRDLAAGMNFNMFEHHVYGLKVK